MTGFPIEKVDFPLITICSQGFAKEIIGNIIKKKEVTLEVKYQVHYNAVSLWCLTGFSLERCSLNEK